MASKNTKNLSKFEPQSIPLLALPFVSFAERKRLPRLAAIYFVLNVEGMVLYVGQSINLALRWAAHHRATKLSEHQATRIAWLVMEDAALLDDVETACLAYFKPICNSRTHPIKKGVQGPSRMPRGPYKKMLVRIPPDILEALEEETTSSDRSVNGELVHVLREWVDQRRQAPRRVYIPATATATP
jgi:hypothetical protein